MPDSPTLSLFKQLCRANEGRGRYIGEGKPPSSHQALNSEHTGSTLCRPERAMRLPAEEAHKATPSDPPPTHTHLSFFSMPSSYVPPTPFVQNACPLWALCQEKPSWGLHRVAVSVPTCTHPPCPLALSPDAKQWACGFLQWGPSPGGQDLSPSCCGSKAWSETHQIGRFIINTEFTSFASE